MIQLPTNHCIEDRLLKSLSWLSGLLLLSFFLYLFYDITIQGFSQISFSFLTDNPVSAGRAGGIGPMLVSTLLLLLLCLLISLPIGIASAVYLAEYTDETQWYARIIQTSLQVLASVPSIVMGLFGYAFFVVALGFGFSILAGALTLACMVLPLLIRNIEDGLRNIPNEYRLNAKALGLSQTRTIFQILLPMASKGILLAITLSIGRAMAETAALLYTSGYVTRMPESLLDSGRSLSVHIFDLSMNVPGGEQKTYASAFTLIILLLLINSITLSLAHRVSHRKLS